MEQKTVNEVIDSTKARELCLKWQAELDSGELGTRLNEKNNGRMLGILLCTDGTVYKAFSGMMLGQHTYSGFVPPVYDVEEVLNLLNRADEEIKKETDSSSKSKISKDCWEKLKKLYKFSCFDGIERSLSDIFPLAPAGTGDCCAPRLLSHCFKNGKKPLSLAEFYYGNGVLKHKEFYSPCDERCKPVLKHIIGLDVIYLDKDIVVVNKPSGLLAIEGRGEDKQDCVAKRVRDFYPACISQPCIHRLDQSTRGLMVLGLTQEAHDILSRDFEEHRVYKEYEALVEGKILETEGIIDLPIRLDTNNRPVQIVDLVQGKKAITTWKRLGIEKTPNGFVTRLKLIPQTGRTHQLRVHCSSGLGHCILNDPIYGNKVEGPLMLQAKRLSFNHPVTKQRMDFELETEF